MGAEESQSPKGVDIGQDMVPPFSEHMGGEAKKRWIILHDKDCQRADGARAQQLGCAGETAWKLRHEELADCSAQKFAPIAFKLS